MVACSSASAPAAVTSRADLGTLSTALTAIGPDGATYSLPLSTYMVASWTGDAGSGNTDLFFNSTAGTESYSLSVGVYSVVVNGVTSLTRTANGVITTVSATLTDPQPYSFTITPGGTTPLALHFTIEGIGNITFSTGTLTTTLDVDAGTTTPTHVTAAGTAAVTADLNGPVGLNQALTFTGTLPVSFTMAIHLTTPFVAGADCVCATGTATVTTASDDAGAAGVNANALFDEASGSSGSICVYDTNSSWNGAIFIDFSRGGGPQTPQMIAAFGPDGGVTGESFGLQFAANPATPLYNGTTATLSALEQPVTMPLNNLAAVFLPNNTYLWNSTAAGTVTLQLTP
jgi:hypothetical protein